jgi:hypothetical protein
MKALAKEYFTYPGLPIIITQESDAAAAE